MAREDGLGIDEYMSWWPGPFLLVLGIALLALGRWLRRG